MKTFKTIIFLALLFSLLIQGCGEEPAPPPPAAVAPDYEGTIVAVGDSLTEGLGVEEESAYPAVLEKKLGNMGYPYRVINAGNSGETPAGPWPE